MTIARTMQAFLSQKRIAGGAFVLALTQFGASLAGLFRDRILAATFPPGIDQLDTVSVYIAAFRPSDLLFQMFIMSAFSVALVPLLASHLAHKREEEMNRLLTSTLIIASTLFGVVSLILALFLPFFAPFLTEFTGDSLHLYIVFGRFACLTNFLFVMGNAFGQYLVAKQGYIWYGITPIIYTLGTIFGTVVLTPTMGVMGPMVGTIVGAFLYVLIRLGAAVQGGYRISLGGRFIHSEISEMGWLMLPRMAALGALQFQLLLFDRIASGLDLGSVTINAYARNFQSAAVGILGIALAQSSYSILSQAVARGELDRFWASLKKGSLLMVFLTIPCAIALAILGSIAARIVHLTEPQVIHTFIIALSFYAISIPFESLNHLLFRASYATKHTVFPAVLTVTGGLCGIVAAWIYAPAYGVYALALGFLSGQALQTIGMWVFLSKTAKRRAEILS